MKTASPVARIFASATMLLVTMGALPAWAQTGDAVAQFNLGVKYDTGEGVPEDDVEAYAWLSIAAAQGVEDAKDFKARISPPMSQSQIAAAQKRSREYWTRYVVPFQ